MESYPYADEWAALRAQRQREYEQFVTLTRWGDLMDIANEIGQSCSPAAPKSTSFEQKNTEFSQGYSEGFSSFTPRYSSYSLNDFGKNRM